MKLGHSANYLDIRNGVAVGELLDTETGLCEILINGGIGSRKSTVVIEDDNSAIYHAGEKALQCDLGWFEQVHINMQQ